jgi:hypothetical protein
VDAERPSEAGVRRMVAELGDMTRVLADAESPDEAEVYNALGLTITCQPEQHRVPLPTSLGCLSLVWGSSVESRLEEDALEVGRGLCDALQAVARKERATRNRRRLRSLALCRRVGQRARNR